MTAPHDPTLVKGYLVGVALREPVAEQRYYVGELQATDALGIRVTGVDWFIGETVGFDQWFPWSNVLGLRDIATPEHSAKNWLDTQANSQRRHNGDPEPERERTAATNGEKPT